MIAANVSQGQPAATTSADPLPLTYSGETHRKNESSPSNVIRLDGYVAAAPTRRTRWPKR